MNPILDKIHKRLHKKDQNYLCIFGGPTGSGKSFSALTLAEAIDPDFNINKVVFSIEEFFNYLNNGNVKKGDVIVWEEMGVAADSRSFMSLQNRAVTYCLETFRHLNIALIMTVPTLDMVDRRVRQLAHMYFETIYIDYGRNRCACRVYDMQCSSKMKGKIYYKYPTHAVNRRMERVYRIHFNMPSRELITPYLMKKKKWTKQLNLSLAKDLENKDEEVLSVEEVVQEVLKEPDRFLKEWRNNTIVNWNKIKAVYKVGETTAKAARTLIEEELDLCV